MFRKGNTEKMSAQKLVILAFFCGILMYTAVETFRREELPGTARVLMEDGTERTAACIGGMCSMLDNECHLLPTTWEWSEDIDIERAEAARDRAEQQLREAAALSEEARIRTESKLYRALGRIGSAKQ